LQPPPDTTGWQTPFSHANPPAQGAVSLQATRHSPSAQIFPSAHSLEYLQVFFASVHDPDTQAWPVEQSFVVAQGQGPAVPPHAWQTLLMHALPSPQSAFVSHSFFVGVVDPGAPQKPALQTSPFGHALSSPQVATQPADVQISFGAQFALPLQALCVGAATVEQP
jgi:hypothetical protein